MPKFSIETLDEWVDNAELPVAIAAMGATAATAATGGAASPLAVGTNLTSAALDLYQGIRAGMKGDWVGVGENAADLALSIIGAKYISKGSKLLRLDKTLNAQGVPRQMITKPVGRGKGKRYMQRTLEKDKGINYLTFGGMSGVPSVIKEYGKAQIKSEQKYKNASITDNTTTIPTRPLERISLQDTTINNNIRKTNIKGNRKTNIKGNRKHK